MDRNGADGTGAAHGSHPHASPVHACCCGSHADEAARAVTVTDPVCGMQVDPATARHRCSHNGNDYFFCSARCRERFEAAPEKFLTPGQPEPAVPAGAIYTCPMHPEVRQ